MLKKNDLYQLVNSLTNEEVRYIFTKYITRKGKEPDYILILKNLLSSTERTDENLRHCFRNHAFINKLDVKKHYLFHWILRHLISFYYGKFKTAVLMLEIDVLIERASYDLAYRLILGCKKKLFASEDYTNMLMLLEKELQVSKFIEGKKSETIINELKDVSKLYYDYQVYKSLELQCRDLLNKYTFVRTEEEFARFEKIMVNPLLANTVTPFSLKNQFSYNLLHYWFNGTINNWTVAFEFAKKNQELVLHHQHIIKGFDDILTSVIYNTCISAISSYNEVELKKSFLLLENISNQCKTGRKHLEAKLFLNLIQLIQINFLGVQNNSFTLLEEAHEFIVQNESKFDRNRLNNYYFDLAKGYMSVNNYKKAFNILQIIIENSDTTENSIDFFYFSRILFCIACYERNDLELLVSFSRSTAYFLRKKNSYLDFEKLILRFFQKELPQIHILSIPKRNSIFTQLKKEVDYYINLPFGQSIIRYFNFPAWIDSKIINPLPFHS